MVAPPPLPIYAQPIIPGPGYIWIPGYWAWGPQGYYWTPGTWVMPPAVGLLWTPGYWAWANGIYIWNAGYWGPHVGYYGGINYGYGYTGDGYFGGRWDNGTFFYNRSVNNFGGRHIADVYNEPVHATNGTRASFYGGQHGTHAQPTAEARSAAQESHVNPTPLQTQHEQAAAGTRALRATVNHGRPAIAATPRPAIFTGRGMVGARPQRQQQARAPAPRQPAARQPASTPHGGQAQHAAPRAHPAAQHPTAKPAGGEQHGHP